MATEGYDWIDDAFDDTKEDPLAKKRSKGCSGLAIALGLLAIVVFVGVCVVAVMGALEVFAVAATS